MSEEDRQQRRPGQEHVDQLKAILEQEALIRAANAAPSEPPDPFLTRIPVVAIVALIFGTVVAHVIRTWNEPPPMPPAVVQVRTDKLSVLTAGQRIEAFRQTHGRLPRDLAEAGLSQDRYVYTTSGDDFEIMVAPEPGESGESSPRYNSSVGPATIIQELAKPLPPPGDGDREGAP